MLATRQEAQACMPKEAQIALSPELGRVFKVTPVFRCIAMGDNGRPALRLNRRSRLAPVN